MVTYFLNGRKTDLRARGVDHLKFGLPPGTSGAPGNLTHVRGLVENDARAATYKAIRQLL